MPLACILPWRRKKIFYAANDCFCFANGGYIIYAGGNTTLKVAKIAVKEETPVDHGEIVCFSIYSGPEADFGNGKSCIWVDVLDGGGKEMLFEFEPFFKDRSIRKVNFYSFCPNFAYLITCYYQNCLYEIYGKYFRLRMNFEREYLKKDSAFLTQSSLSLSFSNDRSLIKPGAKLTYLYLNFDLSLPVFKIYIIPLNSH